MGVQVDTCCIQSKDFTCPHFRLRTSFVRVLLISKTHENNLSDMHPLVSVTSSHAVKQNIPFQQIEEK